VTPIDLGMDWIVSKRKDFIGRRSLFRSDTARSDRKQLVGLLTETPDVVLPEGSQIVESDTPPGATRMQGHVTSSYFGASLDRSIALALVQGGRSRIGDIVPVVAAEGAFVAARVVAPVFLAPEGTRQNG
jgi:sarcosine oxidase, subunit alpha